MIGMNVYTFQKQHLGKGPSQQKADSLFQGNPGFIDIRGEDQVGYQCGRLQMPKWFSGHILE